MTKNLNIYIEKMKYKKEIIHQQPNITLFKTLGTWDKAT